MRELPWSNEIRDEKEAVFIPCLDQYKGNEKLFIAAFSSVALDYLTVEEISTICKKADALYEARKVA